MKSKGLGVDVASVLNYEIMSVCESMKKILDD